MPTKCEHRNVNRMSDTFNASGIETRVWCMDCRTELVFKGGFAERYEMVRLPSTSHQLKEAVADDARWVDGVDLAENLAEMICSVAHSLVMVSACVGAMHFPKMVEKAEGLVVDAHAVLDQARTLAAPPKTIRSIRVVGEGELADEEAEDA